MTDSVQTGLDPAIFAYYRFFCIDVARLQKVESGLESYQYGSRLVLKAHIVGYLVDIELRRSTVIYIVDDGTATCRCVKFHPQVPDIKELKQIGTLLQIRGRLNDYQGERQIVVDSIVELKNPNQEHQYWRRTCQIQQVYQQPLPDALTSDQDKPQLMPQQQRLDDLATAILSLPKVVFTKQQLVTQYKAQLDDVEACLKQLLRRCEIESVAVDQYRCIDWPRLTATLQPVLESAAAVDSGITVSKALEVCRAKSVKLTVHQCHHLLKKLEEDGAVYNVRVLRAGCNC
eukprot:m.26054 g.26054  ORF g.26054 m.26054 type:complete len:288 (-) comp11655_c0_seq9:848-1711(-)